MSQKKKTKRRHEKILEELIAQNFHKKGKEIVIQVQETQRPKQDNPKAKKPKMKHPKTHINQINKDQTQRANIKSGKGKAINNIQVDPHKDNS